MCLLDMAVKEADVAKRKQSGEGTPSSRNDATGIKREWDQAQSAWQQERRATDARINQGNLQLARILSAR